MEVKPRYQVNRIIDSPAVEVITNLEIWAAGRKLRGASGSELIRGGTACAGFKVVQCSVVLEGGTTPTITLQPIEVVEWIDEGTAKDFLTELGSATGALSSGDTFDVTIRNGRLLFAPTAVTGAPTKATILVAGAERDLESFRSA